METAGHISCGVAGWSYPDWEGYVYPAGVRDQLGYLSRFVDMIEVNSTFYRPPEERYAARWAECAAQKPGFFFAAKLHKQITHDGRLTPEMTALFHKGLAPLAAGGLLRHLLAQFRYDFGDSPPHRDLLSRIRDAFGDLAHLVVEVRHNSWQAPEALAWLDALGVTVANLDFPLGRDSFNLDVSPVGAPAYFRLHGRNRAAWFDSEAGRDETYNYLYGRGELDAIGDRARRIAARSTSLTVVANNHWHGQELANALQLKARLSGEKVAVPPLLKARYPDLQEISRD